MNKLKRMVYNYYFSFGYDYPKSTYKYYYQMKRLLEYKNKLKNVLKGYYIPKAFYTGYLNFLRKAYKLIKKRMLLDVEDLINKEVLINRLKEEVLKVIYFLILKGK